MVAFVDVFDETLLTDLLVTGVSAAVASLFQEFPTDNFYYCSLITTGDVVPPSLAVWSHEALAAEAAKLPDPKHRAWLKWSWADSPFYPYGEVHLRPARDLLLSWPRPQPATSADALLACDLKLRAFEAAMLRVDRSGIFGTGLARRRIVLGVEVAPPDWTNAERIRRLNPPEAIVEWLLEAAEPPPPL